MEFTKNTEALLRLPKPKAVIFDWDNTLVDTWPLIQNAIDKAMVKMGREPWGLQKVRDNVHKSMRESFPEIFGDNWQEAGEIYINTYRSTNLKQIQLLPNALRLIKKLEEKGILQFVVSNKIGVTLRKEAASLEVDKNFFALIGANDSYRDKPSKDPVDLALLGSDLDPSKDVIWFVGDTIADVECAYNSGCLPIVFSDLKENISKTMSAKFLSEGGRGEGALPIYFNHQELINLIDFLS